MNISILSTAIMAFLFFASDSPADEQLDRDLPGYNRLVDLIKKTDCNLTEEDVATMYPQLTEAYPDRVFSKCMEDVARGNKSGNECLLGGPVEAGQRLAEAEAQIKDDQEKGITRAAGKTLNKVAKERFKKWSKTRICFEDKNAVKVAVSEAQMEAEEICRNKELSTVPTWMLFKKAKDQSIYGNGDGTVNHDEPHWNMGVRSLGATIFAAESAARVSEAQKSVANKSETVSKSEEKSVSIGQVVSKFIGAENKSGSSSSTTTAGVTSHDVITETHNEAYQQAIRHPEITGMQPTHMCNGNSCWDRSNGVKFPKSQLQEKLECNGTGITCNTDPRIDWEARRAGCVDKEVSAFYDNIGRLEIDYDREFLLSSDDDPETALRLGRCDVKYYGKEFCNKNRQEKFTVAALDMQSAVEESQIDAISNLQKFGFCDDHYLGTQFCQNFRNERVKHFDENQRLEESKKGDLKCKAGMDCGNLGNKGTAILLPEDCRAQASKMAGKSLDEMFPPSFPSSELCKKAFNAGRLNSIDLEGLKNFLKDGKKCTDEHDPLCTNSGTLTPDEVEAMRAGLHPVGEGSNGENRLGLDFSRIPKLTTPRPGAVIPPRFGDNPLGVDLGRVPKPTTPRSGAVNPPRLPTLPPEFQ